MDHTFGARINTTQGKIERYYRTLKQWLTARPLAFSIEELNRQLAEFQRIYNEERPHRALNRRTPARSTGPGARPSPTKPLTPPATTSTESP